MHQDVFRQFSQVNHNNMHAFYYITVYILPVSTNIHAVQMLMCYKLSKYIFFLVVELMTPLLADDFHLDLSEIRRVFYCWSLVAQLKSSEGRTSLVTNDS